MSPYSAFDNNPIFLVDPLGLKSRDASGTVRNGDYKNFWDVLLHRSPKETLKVWGNSVKGLFGPASSDPPIRKWDIADKRKALSPARQAAVAEAHKYVSLRSWDKSEYSQAPGEGDKLGRNRAGNGPVDCAGLVDFCIMAAGYPDPDNGKTTGALDIVSSSRKIDMRDVLPGDVVTISWGTPGKEFGHVGIIVDVQRGNYNEITRIRVVHSVSGKPTPGPVYNQFNTIKGDAADLFKLPSPEGKGQVYPAEYISGYYSWVKIQQNQTIVRPQSGRPVTPLPSPVPPNGGSPVSPISDKYNDGYMTKQLRLLLERIFW
jgi:hypothetical protein